MRSIFFTRHKYVLDLELTINLILILTAAGTQNKVSSDNDIVLITSQSRFQIFDHIPLSDELLALTQIYSKLLGTSDGLDDIFIQTV